MKLVGSSCEGGVPKKITSETLFFSPSTKAEESCKAPAVKLIMRIIVFEGSTSRKFYTRKVSSS